MATTVVVQAPQAFTRGTTIYAPRALPVGPTTITLAVDRTAFTGDPVTRTGDGAVAITWSMFVSLDAGASWAPLGWAGTTGGATGQSTSEFTIDLPEPANANRQVAALMAVTGPVTLGLSATLRP